MATKRKILLESTMRPVIFDWQTKTRKIRVLSAGLIFSANLRDSTELKDYFIGPTPDSDKRWLEVKPDTQITDFIWWDVANKGRLPNIPPKEPVKKFRPKTKTVKGKHGTYIVTNTNGVITCTCPGFKYRQHCKHI